MAFFTLGNGCYIGLALCLLASSGAIASPSINKMQGCQGLIDFIVIKTHEASDRYDEDTLATIRKGLSIYSDDIQERIITPGLMHYNGGDKVKTEMMQLQLDDFKNSIIDRLNVRYPQEKLVTDYAVALNECAKQAVPQGEDLESLKTSLQLIIKLSKQ